MSEPSMENRAASFVTALHEFHQRLSRYAKQLAAAAAEQAVDGITINSTDETPIIINPEDRPDA